MMGWRESDLNGLDWVEEFTRECEQDEGPAHSRERVPFNGQVFWDTRTEEWRKVTASGPYEFVAGLCDEIPVSHDILARCGTPSARSGQALDDMVWYNHGTKQFQRVKGAERITA